MASEFPPFQIGQLVRFRAEHVSFADNRSIAKTLVVTKVFVGFVGRWMVMGDPAEGAKGRRTSGVYAYRLEPIDGPW